MRKLLIPMAATLSIVLSAGITGCGDKDSDTAEEEVVQDTAEENDSAE